MMTTLASTARQTLASLAMLLVVVGGVNCYSNGASPDSCYSMQPLHLSPSTHTPIPPIYCNSGVGDCHGLSLIATQDGMSGGHYSCDSEYEG